MSPSPSPVARVTAPAKAGAVAGSDYHSELRLGAGTELRALVGIVRGRAAGSAPGERLVSALRGREARAHGRVEEHDDDPAVASKPPTVRARAAPNLAHLRR